MDIITGPLLLAAFALVPAEIEYIPLAPKPGAAALFEFPPSIAELEIKCIDG